MIGLGPKVNAMGPSWSIWNDTNRLICCPTARPPPSPLGSRLIPASRSSVATGCQEQFERLADRIGREKAIVAIARKLLVVIWHVLTAKVADRRADPQQVARYFIHWGGNSGWPRPWGSRPVPLPGSS